jgi:NAD(P)-dependent dehydrogenase (short-subunit alcohol dehydrogenase family)
VHVCADATAVPATDTCRQPGHDDNRRGATSGTHCAAPAIDRDTEGWSLGTPEEIARCVLFLVSDDAGFMTASTLTANSGPYMI